MKKQLSTHIFAFCKLMICKIILMANLVCLFNSSALYAVEPYQPKLTVSLNNEKLWRRLDWLDSSQLYSLSTDSGGNLWLGLENRVAFYDGSEVSYFDQSAGLNLTKVTAIFVQSDGSVLAADKNSVFIYQDKKWRLIQTDLNIPYAAQFRSDNKGNSWLAAGDKLLVFNQDNVTAYSNIGRFLVDVLPDASGQIWTLDLESGDVALHNYDETRLTLIKTFSGIVASNESRQKTYQAGQLLESQSGAIWVVNSFSDVPPMSYEPDSEVWLKHQIPSNVNSTILQLPDGHIVVTGQSALHLLENGLWYTVENEKIDLTTSFNQMYLNKQGYLWLMQRRSAILRYDYAGNKNKIYDELFFQCEDRHGRLYFFDPLGNVVINQKNAESWLSYTFDDGIVQNANQLLCTKDGQVIVFGGENGHLSFSIFQPEQAQWQKYVTQFDLSNTSNAVVLESFDRRIFIAVNSIDTNIFRTQMYELEKGSSGEFNVSMIRDLNHRITNLAQISSGELISSGSAVVKIDVNNLQVKPTVLMTKWTDNLVVDQQDNIWISTWASGLRRYENGDWHDIQPIDSIDLSRITQLSTDGEGALLALSEGKLGKYNGKSWHTIDLANVNTKRSGNQIKQTRDGSIWVSSASYHWMYRNYYQEIKQQLFETVRYQPDMSPPDTHVDWISKQDKYSKTVYFTLSGVDKWNNTPSANLQYSYRIDGQPWSEFSSQTTNFISDLDSGSYVLQARARDGDGNVDDTPYELKFDINLPFWQTIWFWLLCSFTLLTVLGLLAMLYIQRARNLAALEKSRLQFLTHISHELRTPLTLIKSPLETIDTTVLGEKVGKKIEIALRNSKRLSILVEQILDYRKVQAGKHRLNHLSGDIVAFSQGLVNDFSELAKQQAQSVKFNSNCTQQMCLFDPDVLHKILDNLLFNALKYTPAGGHVELTLIATNNQIRYEIEDNGDGINEKLLKNMFKPFFSGEKSSHSQFSSFGIGLALVQELVELWEGDVSVESPIFAKDNKKYGTRIKINLPLEMQSDKVTEFQSDHCLTLTDENLLFQNKKPLLLLVDDHLELLDYLANELAEDYLVLKANNAEIAIKVAQLKVPDIIISDVCMPGMDGVQMCKILKSCTETSHIPIILQTSYASESKQIEALNLGAIDFLTKPVSIDILLSKIASQLSARDKLSQRFKVQHLATFMDKQEDFIPPESKFMTRVINVVEKNYPETTFSAEILAKEMMMSRSAFYRKFSALVGIPPAEYIKNFRLDKAAILLKQGAYIAQVAEQIGYTEASPFNRAFKKYFNLTPSQYRKVSQEKRLKTEDLTSIP